VRINLRKTLFILPNLFTLSSIFCGFYAILLSGGSPTPDDLYRASVLIIFAMFFDMVDGRVARLTRTQSAFGVEIDSLADVVSFGVAPAVLVHAWSLHALGRLGVAACFAYVACGAIRLARFNVLATDTSGRPKKPSKYILGLPIPGAAGVLVSLVAANHAVNGEVAAAHWPILFVVFALSFFMVSTITFRSFKELRFTLRTAMLLLLAVASGIVLAVKVHITVALGWMLASYVMIGLVESTIGLLRRLRRQPRTEEEDPAQAG
jgi:CDP-diacylglycerol--serine O-phosphatidyltransferase